MVNASEATQHYAVASAAASGQSRGKRLISGGQASVSAALYMGAFVATRYKPLIQRFYYFLVAAGKPK